MDITSIINAGVANLEKLESESQPKEEVPEPKAEEQEETPEETEETQEGAEEDESEVEAKEEEKPKEPKKLAEKAKAERERRQEIAQLRSDNKIIKEDYARMYNWYSGLKKDPVEWLEQNIPDDVYQKWALRKAGLASSPQEEEKVTKADLERLRQEQQEEYQRQQMQVESQRAAQMYSNDVFDLASKLEDVSDLNEYVQDAHETNFYEYAMAEATAYAKECVAKEIAYDVTAEDLVEAVATHIRKQMAAGQKVKSKNKKAEEVIESSAPKKSKPKTLTSSVRSTPKSKVMNTKDDVIADAIARLG